MKYIMRLIAILIGIAGAVLYFFFDMSNLAFWLFAAGGVILFFDIRANK